MAKEKDKQQEQEQQQTTLFQSQSSEVAYLHSENRFLYDGSLFFFFF